MSTETIRLAVETDLPQVVDGIEAIRHGTLWEHLVPEPNRLHILRWLMHTLTNDPTHALFVADLDETIIGLVGGNLVTEYFVPDMLFLYEWAWWVKPEARGDGIGWRLWKALMGWAKERGASGAIYAKSIKVPDLTRPHAFEKRVWMPLEESHVIRVQQTERGTAVAV